MRGLKRLGVVVGLGALLLGMALPFAYEASAQPAPPVRFFGTVKDAKGANVAAGTAIEAKIGGATCGRTTVTTDAGNSVYVVDVVSAGQTAGCGTAGASVSFTIGGQPAKETGSWAGATQQVNLTVGAAAAVTVTAPKTGTGGLLDESGSGVGWWLVALAGVLAVAGSAGAYTYRRVRR